MSADFDFSHPPFDCLNSEEQNQMLKALNIAYFSNGDVILAADSSASDLHIIVKGAVEETDKTGETIYAHYTQDDLFDLRSQFEENCKHRYIALEETLCYTLSREIFQHFYHSNQSFADYFQSNLASRSEAISDPKNQQNLAEFILTDINENNIQPVTILSDQTTIQSATEALKGNPCDALLIEHDGQYGLITRTDLLHALVFEHLELDDNVHRFATYNLVTIEKGDFLFNALVKMMRDRVKRIVVKDGERIAGILDMTNLLSQFSTHSHVLTMQIARAKTIEALKVASSAQSKLVTNLSNNGIRIEFIMKLISAVNEQVIRKAFEMSVPEAFHADVCLIVMGSEGRHEQILKTDQDNGIIAKNRMVIDAIQPYLQQFSKILIELGYPPCPGDVMVTNPFWVRTVEEWQEQVKDWAEHARVKDMMPLAIITDAHAVSGDEKLLRQLRRELLKVMTKQALTLSWFARPAVGFATPLTLFGGIKEGKEGIDIKKGGIFPIVHGARVLALEHHIEATNTIERLNHLKKKHVLEGSTADNLIEAFQLFVELRLHHQVAEEAQGTDHSVEMEELTRAERDLLRHALHVVKKFKSFIAYHYQIRE